MQSTHYPLTGLYRLRQPESLILSSVDAATHVLFLQLLDTFVTMEHIKPEKIFVALYEDGNLLPEELQHASRCRYCHEWLIVSLDIAAHGGITPKFTVPKLETE